MKTRSQASKSATDPGASAVSHPSHAASVLRVATENRHGNKQTTGSQPRTGAGSRGATDEDAPQARRQYQTRQRASSNGYAPGVQKPNVHDQSQSAPGTVSAKQASQQKRAQKAEKVTQGIKKLADLQKQRIAEDQADAEYLEARRGRPPARPVADLGHSKDKSSTGTKNIATVKQPRVHTSTESRDLLVDSRPSSHQDPQPPRSTQVQADAQRPPASFPDWELSSESDDALNKAIQDLRRLRRKLGRIKPVRLRSPTPSPVRRAHFTIRIPPRALQRLRAAESQQNQVNTDTSGVEPTARAPAQGNKRPRLADERAASGDDMGFADLNISTTSEHGAFVDMDSSAHEDPAYAQTPRGDNMDGSSTNAGDPGYSHDLHPQHDPEDLVAFDFERWDPFDDNSIPVQLGEEADGARHDPQDGYGSVGQDDDSGAGGHWQDNNVGASQYAYDVSPANGDDVPQDHGDAISRGDGDSDGALQDDDDRLSQGDGNAVLYGLPEDDGDALPEDDDGELLQDDGDAQDDNADPEFIDNNEGSYCGSDIDDVDDLQSDSSDIEEDNMPLHTKPTASQRKKFKRTDIRQQIASHYQGSTIRKSAKRRHERSPSPPLPKRAPKRKDRDGDAFRPNWQRLQQQRLPPDGARKLSKGTPRSRGAAVKSSASSRRTSTQRWRDAVVNDSSDVEDDDERDDDGERGARVAFADTDVATTRAYATAMSARRSQMRLLVETVDSSDASEAERTGAKSQSKRPRRSPSEIPDDKSRSVNNVPNFVKPVLTSRIIPTVLDYCGAKKYPWNLRQYGRDELLALCQELIDMTCPNSNYELSKTDIIYKVIRQAVYDWRAGFANAAVAAIAAAIDEKFGPKPKQKVVKLWVRKATDAGGESLWAKPHRKPERAQGALQSKYVLKSFAHHIIATEGSLLDYGYPCGALALAATAVQHIFPMFASGTFKPGKPFSAANVMHLTEGWYRKRVRRLTKKPEKFAIIIRQATKLAVACRAPRVPAGGIEVLDVFDRSSPVIVDLDGSNDDDSGTD